MACHTARYDSEELRPPSEFQRQDVFSSTCFNREQFTERKCHQVIIMLTYHTGNLAMMCLDVWLQRNHSSWSYELIELCNVPVAGGKTALPSALYSKSLSASCPRFTY